MAEKASRGNRRAGKHEAHDGQQGQRTRHAARLADFAPDGQSLHATVYSRMETARLGEAVGSTYRELCRRLRNPVPRIGTGGARTDAENHESAQTDREREENQDLSTARRKLRLSGLYDRAVLLDPDWPRLSGNPTGKEADCPH